VFQAIEPFFGGHAITPLCTGVRQLLGGGICADRRRVGAFDDTRRMPTPEAKSRCVCRCPAIGRIRLAYYIRRVLRFRRIRGEKFQITNSINSSGTQGASSGCSGRRLAPVIRRPMRPYAFRWWRVKERIRARF
jgi:hypothetical protein